MAFDSAGLRVKEVGDHASIYQHSTTLLLHEWFISRTQCCTASSQSSCAPRALISVSYEHNGPRTILHVALVVHECQSKAESGMDGVGVGSGQVDLTRRTKVRPADPETARSSVGYARANHARSVQVALGCCDLTSSKSSRLRAIAHQCHGTNVLRISPSMERAKFLRQA